jgi:ABC-type amino acid transport system permease subunit
MTGLDWVYTNYNCSTRNTSRESIISGFTFIPNTASVNIVQNPILTFRKCNTTDITINLYAIMGTLPAMNANTIFPQMSFYFMIIPIEP